MTTPLIDPVTGKPLPSQPYEDPDLWEIMQTLPEIPEDAEELRQRVHGGMTQ